MDKLSGKAADLTRAEWRELGFYYVSHEGEKNWELHGSKNGLLKLCALIKKFADENRVYGDHEHLLPHWYLTLTAINSFTIDERGIGGTPEQLRNFANFFQSKVFSSKVGSTDSVSKETFSTDYSIEYTVQGDNFDPSSQDPQL